MINTRIFKNKNFTLLFWGKMVSDLGDQILNLAVGWHILKITNSAFKMSLYISLGTLIYLVLGPYGGVIADRIDRVKIIYMTDLIRGISQLALSIIMYMGMDNMLIYYISSIIISLCGIFFYPASMSIIPEVVDDKELNDANSLISMIQSFSSTVGLLAGGLLYGIVGIKGVFLINSLTYLVSGIWEVRIKTNICKAHNSNILKGNIFKDVKNAFLLIKTERPIFILLIFSICINFFITPLLVVFIPFTLSQYLRTEPIVLSLVQGAGSMGYILGAMMLSSLLKRNKWSKQIIMGTILYSFATLAIAISLMLNFKSIINVSYLILCTVVSMGFMGIFNAIINITINITIQRIVAKEYLGRVNALWSTIVMAVTPASMMIGGFLVDRLSVIILIIITAIMLTFISLTLSFNKEIINI